MVAPDNRFVGMIVEEKPEQSSAATVRATYLLDLKSGEHRRLGSDLMLIPTENHQFISIATDMSSIAPALIDGLETVRTFDIGKHNGGFWNAGAKMAIFETGWPPNAEGFNELTLIKLDSGNMTKVSTATAELIGACRATGDFYTEHHLETGAGTDEYDAAGKLVKTLHSDLAVFSAGCKYVLPFVALSLHGPDDWAIYDAQSHAKLADFPWNEDGKTDLHWFQAWNPQDDKLLQMHSSRAATKTDTLDIYDVTAQKVIKSWPDSAAASPTVWSGDGKATVTVRDHHIVFDPL
jgi:hypothetical protein